MVLALESLLLVDSDALDATILAEVLIAAQGVFFGDVWGQADHIEGVSLQDSHLTQLLLKSLLLGRIALFLPAPWCDDQLL